MTNHFSAGSLVKLTSTFQDADEVLFNPTDVKITIEDPNGTITTYEYGVDGGLIKDSTGIYHIDVDTTGKPGTWHYRWFSLGTGQASSKNLAFVVGRNIPEEA